MPRRTKILERIPKPRSYKKRGEIVKQLLPELRRFGYKVMDVLDWGIGEGCKLGEFILYDFAREGGIPEWLLDEYARELYYHPDFEVPPYYTKQVIDKLIKFGVLERVGNRILISDFGRKLLSLGTKIDWSDVVLGKFWK